MAAESWGDGLLVQTSSNTTNTGSSTFAEWLWSWETVWLFFIKLLIAIVIVGILVLLAKLFSKFVSKRLKSHSIVDDEYTGKVSGLVGEIIFYTLLVLSLLIGFTILGIDFGWILWGISFGIWFAFKDILGNLIAGILVLTNKEFKLGDVIVVDDEKKDYFGRIEEITIRYTVVRTFDLRKVIIPNLTLITKPIRTYDSEEVIRLDTVFTIHYGSDVETSLAIIKDAVNSVDYVKETQSTKVSVIQFGNHWLEILVYFYFDPNSGMLIQSAKSWVHKAIFQAFRDKGIVIPYPHSTLTVDYNDKNLLGSMIYVAKEAHKDE